MRTGLKENASKAGAQQNVDKPQSGKTASSAEWLILLAIGALIVAWALRGSATNNIVDTDAARHAMNGAFLHDLATTGSWAKPIEFGRYYYGRLPALSMPYHPPVFPALEALFFFPFGVSLITARVLVAILSALALVLFCCLVRRTHRSLLLGAAAVVTFCAWRYTQMVASDVMLEFPSLLFAIAALLSMHNFFRNRALLWALAFAVLAGAAVWTKQHAVFIGAVPIVYAVFSRRWDVLKSFGLWIASMIFAIEVLALSLLSIPFRNTGTDQVVQADFVGEAMHHLRFYWEATVGELGIMTACVLVGTAVAAVITAIRGRGDSPDIALHLSWAGCAFGVLLLTRPFDARYLFFVYPPLIVITYDMLSRAARFVPKLRPIYVPALAAALFLIITLKTPAYYLTGPTEAAEAVVTKSQKRVLYCGSTDGNFIFAVRVLDPGLSTIVISGEKLPKESRQPAELEAFAHRYGINEVIVEDTARPQACAEIRRSPPESFKLTKIVPIHSSLPRWEGGTLSIYRVNNPASRPDEILTLPVPRIGSSVDVAF
jgi:4-amino-4-deoxy-L-arabinose transferase-like glycosyltransferase